jgi:hypothetical protein
VALGLAMLVGCLTITLGTGLFLWHRSEPPANPGPTLAAAEPWLFAWRCLLFGALIGFWPAFCRGAARWRRLTNDQLARLREARWQVAAWLMALELLLGQNAAGRFLNLLVAR